MNHTNWISHPKFTIDCNKLSEPAQVCNIFKHFGVDKYIYRFTYNDSMVIKYGMSSPESRSRVPGERVYRQLAHCQSWGSRRIDGSSGSDWLIIERDFRQKFGVDIDHKCLKITVWDFTNFPFRSVDIQKEIKSFESEIIDHHAKTVGYKPIGNINDEANYRGRAFISKSVWSANFEDPELLLE